MPDDQVPTFAEVLLALRDLQLWRSNLNANFCHPIDSALRMLDASIGALQHHVMTEMAQFERRYAGFYDILLRLEQRVTALEQREGASPILDEAEQILRQARHEP